MLDRSEIDALQDPRILPGFQRLLMIFGRALARVSDEEAAYDAGRSLDAEQADVEIRQRYIEEAKEIIKATGKESELALFAATTRYAHNLINDTDSIDYVERFIVDRKMKLEHLRGLYSEWEKGEGPSFGPSWPQKTYKAIKKLERVIAFAKTSRLRLLRASAVDEMISKVNAENQRQMTLRAQEKEKRIHLVRRCEVQKAAILKVLKDDHPDIWQKAIDASSAAVRAFEESTEKA